MPKEVFPPQAPRGQQPCLTDFTPWRNPRASVPATCSLPVRGGREDACASAMPGTALHSASCTALPPVSGTLQRPLTCFPMHRGARSRTRASQRHRTSGRQPQHRPRANARFSLADEIDGRQGHRHRTSNPPHAAFHE